VAVIKAAVSNTALLSNKIKFLFAIAEKLKIPNIPQIKADKKEAKLGGYLKSNFFSQLEQISAVKSFSEFPLFLR
jgi:hypothetical protein